MNSQTANAASNYTQLKLPAPTSRAAVRELLNVRCHSDGDYGDYYSQYRDYYTS